MSCAFCKLNPKRNKVIYEGKTVFVILSNPRLAEGHLLLIPKRHIEKPSEMSPAERKELFDTVLMFQDKIITKVSKGCDIRENYRPFQNEDELKVHHIHFHLIPREFKDEIYDTYEKHQTSVFKMMSEKQMAKSLEMFKD